MKLHVGTETLPRSLYEAPVLVDAADLAAAPRAERVGCCNTGGSSVVVDED